MIEGTRTYRHIEEEIESAAQSWASARIERLAGNRRECEELRAKQSARQAEVRADSATCAVFKREMKKLSPPGCLLPMLF